MRTLGLILEYTITGVAALAVTTAYVVIFAIVIATIGVGLLLALAVGLYLMAVTVVRKGLGYDA